MYKKIFELNPDLHKLNEDPSTALFSGDPALLPASALVRLAECASLRILRPGLLVVTPPNFEATSAVVFELAALFSANKNGANSKSENDALESRLCKTEKLSNGEQELPVPLQTCRNVGFLCFDQHGYVNVDAFKRCLVIHKVLL